MGQHWRGTRRAAAFLLGVGGDALLGDPPNALHPVRAIGLCAHWYEAHSRVVASPRLAGLGGACAIPAFAGGVATAFEATAGRWRGGRVLAAGACLALAGAQHTLMRRAIQVAGALEAGDLDEARRLLGYHLVSRDTGDLSAGEVAGATIESVAENLGDGVAGPWLAFALGGSGGAWAYRALNTLDSLWGYRSERYAEFGWAAARLDDLANLVPSRAAALAICLGASGHRGIRPAFDVWRRDGRLTESPNAGQPMAAMAGALGVTLAKRGHYVLGSEFRTPDASDIRASVKVGRRASMVLAVLGLAVVVARGGR